jgi:hypothetical protein
LQPCRISRCLYTPYEVNQQIFGFIIDQSRTSQLQLWHHQWLLHATHLSRSCWVSSDTGHCWFEASSRLARL